MDSRITGPVIRRLRLAKGLTQSALAEKLHVSPKTISKWETARGLPDLALLDALAGALEVSIAELMSGSTVMNRNISANLLRSRLYVCPACGNIIHTTGEAVISCCGMLLSPLLPAEPDEEHAITIEAVEDEHFITLRHAMTKEHFISFLAYVTGDRFHLVKLYPEGNAECRFRFRGRGYLYAYCSRHGLMRQRV